MIKFLFLLIALGVVFYLLKKTITVKLFSIDIQDNNPLKKNSKEIDITEESRIVEERKNKI